MPKSPLKHVNEDGMATIAQRFRALGEVSRLRIIRQLQSGEKNVSQFVEQTGLSQPNVSRHLSILVSAKLIGHRKDGLNVLYRIVDENLSDMCAIVCRSLG